MALDASSHTKIMVNAWGKGVDCSDYTSESRKGLAIKGSSRGPLDNTNRSQDDQYTGLVLQRSRNLDQYMHTPSRPQTHDPLHPQAPSRQRKFSSDYFSPRKRSSLQLPSFTSLGISTGSLILSVHDTEPVAVALSSDGPTSWCALSSNSNRISTAICGTLPPLTPPPEELSGSNMNDPSASFLVNSNDCSSLQSDQTSRREVPRQEATGSRVQGKQGPESSAISNPPQLHELPWVARASHKLITILGANCPQDAIQVVSQTLPCQARDGRSKPTFEAILESLQADMDSSPYITITHAVPQARVMEELPKTPPSTPNFRNEMSDYFDNNQTIFTHAAVVPIYHSHDRANFALAGKLVHHIAAPCSTQVSILERYIPPTMPKEIEDFFGLSTRSYLSDRLSELSTRNGSLLLVYPTRSGGDTFARQYIGPLIDPYLRRFIMLKGLTSIAAELMGKMTAVNHMLDFEEMRSRVAALCQNLTNQPAVRGPRSAFNITHSEVTNTVLARSTWLNWYVEQEQSRLKQNLVEYHQEGGRMPESDGNQEITVGMLTRDFIDGLQKSKEVSGGVAIEVGMFLITRSKV